MMQAIILAGGLGTRLRGVLPDLPKPMAPVAGSPFLCHVLDPLCDAGFERAVLAVGYRHEAIRDHFGDSYRGLRLDYSVEPAPLGTGGAMRLAARQTDAAAPFFVLNGDTYLELDYHAMLAEHLAAHARMSMAACLVADVGRYGALEIQDGVVRGFLEKGSSGPGRINAGTYLLRRELLGATTDAAPFSFEQQLLAQHIGDIRPLAFLADGQFIDIGVPEDYARAQAMFQRDG